MVRLQLLFSLKGSWLWNPSSETDFLLLMTQVSWTTPEAKLLQFIELGWYTAGLINLLTDPGHRKSDFKMMLFHHLLTIYLIEYSYAFGLMRFAALVLLIHNVGDLFLHLAKLFNYTVPQLQLHKVCAVGLGIGFGWPRCVWLPQIVWGMGTCMYK